MLNITVQKIIEALKRNCPELTEDQKTFRSRWPSERYIVDFAEDFSILGWLQFYTDQDASYFGVWVNPKTYQTLSYCEGDWTLVECINNKAYNSEIDLLCNFYDSGAIDSNGTLALFYQDRKDMYAH